MLELTDLALVAPAALPGAAGSLCGLRDVWVGLHGVAMPLDGAPARVAARRPGDLIEAGETDPVLALIDQLKYGA